MSQIHIIGLHPPETWDEIERCCLATYAGGHRDEYLAAFQHGMRTVFTLLRREFPPAEEIKSWQRFKGR